MWQEGTVRPVHDKAVQHHNAWRVLCLRSQAQPLWAHQGFFSNHVWWLH